jgi:beta-ureidopropionase / N-carbamoyl-L-amino-acid hydrolase
MSNPAYPGINSKRLWQRHLDMAKLGATAGGGVHRLALTQLDIEAHKLLSEWASPHGFNVSLDPIGNMFIRREGSDPSLPPIASGSHTDTQPNGGRFDGITGVLTAFEAMETIHEAGIETRHPLETIVWNNEEGPRFLPSCMGSAAYAGAEPLKAMLASEDGDGITMGSCVDALKNALPHAGSRELGAPLSAFIEVHIEQGTELEASGNTIGVVTGMQGYRRFAVAVTGEDAHSGTTPRARRKDAFVAATDMARALREKLKDEEDVLRFTIGRFEVLPGGITVVPGRVNFTIDIRHPDADVLLELGDQVEPICKREAGPCEVAVNNLITQDPLEFPAGMKQRITAAAQRRGYSSQPIFCCAGHDARHISKLCPAGMIFIPCWKGISHNEAERAEPEDIAAASQIIADMLIDLANET